MRFITLFLFCSIFACKNEKQVSSSPPLPQASEKIKVASSLFEKPFYASPPSSALLEKLKIHEEAYEANPDDLEKNIWYGRFIAYTGDYPKAIAFYTKAINQFPEDPRLLRHRGHRYLSIRAFDKAIADFEKAETLIAGTENEIEPDGMPNAQNIPVSTLHGNIYYHLGLAHYLKNDLQKALTGFEKCRDSWSNDDNKVSSTHWIYMILKRMGKDEEAEKALQIISKEMNIIENFTYHKLCLFYKNEMTVEELTTGDSGAAATDDATNYGLGNWYYYNGQKERAHAIFDKITNGDSWNSFGFIAAEADLFNNF